jgi:hypothetical protein
MHCLQCFFNEGLKKQEISRVLYPRFRRDNSHFSWQAVARLLYAAYPGIITGGIDPSSLIWPCSERGLPQTPSLTSAVVSYTAVSPLLCRLRQSGLVSVALSVGSRRPDVIGRSDSPKLGLSSLRLQQAERDCSSCFFKQSLDSIYQKQLTSHLQKTNTSAGSLALLLSPTPNGGAIRRFQPK